MLLRVLKKTAFLGVYAMYVLLVLAAVDYFFFYRPRVAELRKETRGAMPSSRNPHFTRLPSVRYVDPEVMKLLGKANGNKESHFQNFEKAKGAGVFRICAFGDSYTAGDEVDGVYDYPSILGRRFEELAPGRIEVVNFGIGGYGLHQTYILWERVARGFDCDVHLLGPRGFQSIRDTTFGFILDWTPYYLHARYVLKDGDLELVDVPGETYGERFDHHFRFLTPWRYLRYSRNPPMFLSALVSRDQTLPNPFYYDRRDLDEEAQATYEILLRRLADFGVPVLLGPHRPEIVDLADRVGAENLTASRFHEKLTFPYLAPYSHASPVGNQFLAEQFFLRLTGRDDPLRVIETSDFDRPGGFAAPAAPLRPIRSLSRLDVEVAGVAVGRFIVSNTVYKPLDTDGLLSLSGPEETVLDGCWVPLDFELRPGMEVTLETGAGERSLGRVALLPGGLNLGRVKVEGLRFWSYKEFERRSERGEPSPLTHGKRRVRGLFLGSAEARGLDRGSVLVDGHPALEGERGRLGRESGLWLTPVESPCRLVRGRRSGLLDLDSMAAAGTVDFVAEHWEAGLVRVPAALWTKTTVEPDRPRNPLKISLPASRDDSGREP